MEDRVRQLYDYDAIIAQAPPPDGPLGVTWVFGSQTTVKLSNWPAGIPADHRGTPEAPGRTVTLEPAAGCDCYGIAYRLPDDVEERSLALQELEWREKQYDEKHRVDVYTEDGSLAVAGALTYVGSTDRSKNVNYGGALPMNELAQQIVRAVGPSGSNIDYLFGVAEGLRRIQAVDDHVFKLEALVKELMEAELFRSTV